MNPKKGIRKEACWTISNITAGTKEQIQLVMEASIKPLCDLLDAKDARIVSVALEGLENILRVGQEEAQAKGEPQSEYGQFIDVAGGLDKIEQLQSHQQIEIYEKAMKIISKYF